MADRYRDERRTGGEPDEQEGYTRPRSYHNRYNRGFSRMDYDREAYGPSMRNEQDYEMSGQNYREEIYRDMPETEPGYGWDRAPYEDYRGDYFQGPHAGKGPRGYKRSDERICEDVCDRLAEHGYIDASEIDVTVENGVVILRGTIEDRRTKRMAEDTVEMVNGVIDVQNELRLRGMGEMISSPPAEQKKTRKPRSASKAPAAEEGAAPKRRGRKPKAVAGGETSDGG